MNVILVLSPRDPGRYRYKLSLSDLSDAADGSIEDLTVPQKLNKESNRKKNAVKLTEKYGYKDMQIQGKLINHTKLSTKRFAFQI